MASKSNSAPLLHLTLLTAIVISLLWFYWSNLFILAKELTTNEDYSFGLLMPIVSGYIIYLKWPQIRSYVWRPSWWGLMVMALGVLLYAFGELLAIYYFPPISCLIVITGLLLLLGGWGLVRLLGFPLFLLFFMIPLPSLIMKNLTLPLQLISSQLAVVFFHILGIPVLRQGNVIDMGVRQLQVVEACSGLRYILSLTSLGFIYCYFYQRTFWKAAILLVTLIPGAIIANALRVAAMGIFPALQQGFWHGFSGWLIFLFCFGVLLLFNWILNYLGPPTPESTDKATSSTAAAPAPSYPPGFTLYLIAALSFVLLAAPLAIRLANAPPVALVQSFDKFPLQLGDWQGKRDYLESSMARAVGADDYLEVGFTNPGDHPVNLWIAFFQSQNQKIEGRIHSPQICLAGSGWNFIESRIINLAPGCPVRYILMERSGSKQVVYYWYLQRGRWLASEYSTKLYMGLDGLLKRRNDGAIIRLITPVDRDVESGRHRLNAFAKLLIPLLPQFIPR